MSLPRLVPAACLAVAALALGGCGGSGSTTSTPPTSPAPVTHSSAPVDPTSAPPTVAPTTAPSTAPATTTPSTGAPAEPTPSASIDLSSKSLTGITSPSGKIACLLTPGPTTARCDVQGSRWAVATPSSCPQAYGDSAEVGPRTSRLTCHGDTVFGAPDQVTLPYGQTARYRTIVCTSAPAGITCRNALGHGFTVSPTAYKLF